MIRKSLNEIRKVIESDIIADDNEPAIIEKIMKLQQLAGLAAECKGLARKELETGKLAAIMKHKDSFTGNILMAAINAECADQHAMYEYADRINSAITVAIDGLRSVLSYKKSELENSLK